MSVRRKQGGSRGGVTEIKGPTMAHVGFQGARHMHPERVPSAKKERTLSLRLFDIEEGTLKNIEKHSHSVKILMLHGLQLSNLSDDLITRMVLLGKLDLSDNKLADASLPESFKKLEHLVELNLSSNNFSSIPSVVKKLRNLTRLSVSNNSVDNLKGMENLKKMQILLLDNNKVSSVFKDISHMRKLEILDCSFNSIRELGLDIRFLKNLKELNISKNRISVLPTDVFQLNHLESLKASQNQISKIPVFNMNPQHCHHISEIDLSSNTINKFPGHLLTIVKKLDLSGNRIKVLDWNKMKKVEVTSEKVLCVDDNPLTFPPIDICECGLKSMMRFFQETQLNMKVHQGIKVLVLGAKNSGKTSFVQTLIDGQPRLSEDMYETSAGIEVSEMALDIQEPLEKLEAAQPKFARPETSSAKSRASSETSSVKSRASMETSSAKSRSSMEISSAKSRSSSSGYGTSSSRGQGSNKSLNHIITDTNGHIGVVSEDSSQEDSEPQKKTLHLCIWDFCGNSFYLYPHYVFFEQPAIAVLTFNMFTYKSEGFDEMVGSWFDWMIAKTNKLVVLLVGTHADKMKKESIKEVCNEVKARLQAHAEKQRNIVQERIHVITEKPHISQTLSAQLNTYSLLLQEKFVVQSEVIVTSASKYTGYQTVVASMEALAKDSRQFPNVLRPIPTFWVDIETYLEEKGNTMVVPIVKFDQLKEEIGVKFGMKHLLTTILHYLHETGKVLWFTPNPSLKDHVILRPPWFFDIFRAIFRHDLSEKLDIEVEDSFKTIGITQGKYDQLKEEFLTEGVVDRDLLKCMLSHLLPLETNGPFYEVLDLLLNNLDLGYLVSKRSHETGYNLDPETESMHTTKYLIPWFRNVPEPASVKEAWDKLEKRRRLAGVCRFPRYMPPGLFHVLSVRAHREKHKLRFLSHWGSGFHARHKEENLQLLFTYYQHETGQGTTLRFEMRDDCPDKVFDEVPASTMWTILLPILMDFEELLRSYTGVLVERLMECPNCCKLSFIGEWLTPKETQGMSTRSCDECMEEIDTAFLVQPKEKKRDDVRLKLARLRRERRDALIESAEVKGIRGVQSHVRTGRRAAVMPMENVMFPSISDVGSNIDGSDDDSTRRPSNGLLCGTDTVVSREDGHGPDDSDSDYGESAGSRRTTGILPGLTTLEMSSFLARINVALPDEEPVNEHTQMTSP